MASATGRRDLRINDRHRKFGQDCPGVDLDFVLIEYDIRWCEFGIVLATAVLGIVEAVCYFRKEKEEK